MSKTSILCNIYHEQGHETSLEAKKETPQSDIYINKIANKFYFSV